LIFWMSRDSKDTVPAHLLPFSMAQRRYGLQFSLPEGCILLLGLLFSSAVIFLGGLYIGKEIEVHDSYQRAETVRLPVSALQESPATQVAPTPSPSVALRSPTAKETPPRPELKVQPKNTPVQSARKEKPTVQERPVAKEKPELEVATPTSDVMQTSGTRGWGVQVHETKSATEARKTADSLRRQGYTPIIKKVVEQGQTRFQVRVGVFANQEEAVKVVVTLRNTHAFDQVHMIEE
jgi:cell division septation protein DedD